MKIILAVTDLNGKNAGFVSDTAQILSLEEASRFIHSGALKGMCVVKSRYGNYVRATPNTDQKDNLDIISVSGRDLLFYANQTRHPVSTPPISAYLERYLASLKEGKPFLTPVGQKKILVADIKDKFNPHILIITAAANEFKLDKCLIGAILIDELSRMHPFELLIDLLGAKMVGRNVSVGVMQVKIDTANQLIKKGFYCPNSADKKIPFKGTLSNKDRVHLYGYLIQSKHNIRFASARIRDLIDEWAKIADISEKPEIIATLYSLPYRKPHSKPEPNERGNQIATEFYAFAKKWLSEN